MSLDWIHLAEVTARANQRRITPKTCLQCCSSSDERGIGSSGRWQELLLKMAKECYSVRACRTPFLKLPVRFSSLLRAGVTCPQEQQGYTFFYNTWLRLGFRLWQGSHRRKHPKPVQPCLTRCPKQAFISQRCHLGLPGDEVKSLGLLPSVDVILSPNFLSGGSSAGFWMLAVPSSGFRPGTGRFKSSELQNLLQIYRSLRHSWWDLDFNSQESGGKLYPCFNSIFLWMTKNRDEFIPKCFEPLL